MICELHMTDEKTIITTYEKSNCFTAAIIWKFTHGSSTV